MFKKYVLAFLLLFFSSVSFATNTFFDSFDAAFADCQSQVSLYSPLISNGKYACDVHTYSSGLNSDSFDAVETANSKLL